MKKFRFSVLLLSFIIFFSFSLGAQEDQRTQKTEAQKTNAQATGAEEDQKTNAQATGTQGAGTRASATESGLGCVGVECVGQEKSVAEEALALCFKTLPEQCQRVKNPKLTVCRESISSGFWAAAGTGIASSLTGCLKGILSGLIDSAHILGKAVIGTWGFLTDEVVRDEAGMAMSNLMEEISSDEGDEFLKELILSGLMEALDEFADCLNFEGRVKYFCEGGVQTTLGVVGFVWTKRKLSKAKYAVTDRIRLMRQGVRLNLTPRQKVKQKQALKEKLRGRSTIYADTLTPYQMSQLSRSQIKRRVDFGVFSDDLAAFMSKGQIRAIPVDKLAKTDTVKIAGTLGRLSNKQFRAMISKSDITGLPAFAIEQNIKRIPASRIGMFNNINGVPPNKLSVAQIRALSDAQMSGWDHINVTRWNPMKRRAFKSRQARYSQDAAEASAVVKPASAPKAKGKKVKKEAEAKAKAKEAKKAKKEAEAQARAEAKEAKKAKKEAEAQAKANESTSQSSAGGNASGSASGGGAGKAGSGGAGASTAGGQGAQGAGSSGMKRLREVEDRIKADQKKSGGG